MSTNWEQDAQERDLWIANAGGALTLYVRCLSPSRWQPWVASTSGSFELPICVDQDSAEQAVVAHAAKALIEEVRVLLAMFPLCDKCRRPLAAGTALELARVVAALMPICPNVGGLTGFSLVAAGSNCRRAAENTPPESTSPTAGPAPERST